MIYQVNNSATTALPSNLVYSAPAQVSQGNYLIRCLSKDKTTIYIQPPVCRTKTNLWTTPPSTSDTNQPNQNQKLVRKYIELLFTRDDLVFTEWIDKLTAECREHIYNNREKWFDASLDKTVIEKCFLPSVRMIKSTAPEYTKSHFSVKVGIPGIGGACGIRVFDEMEQVVDPSTVLPSQTLQVVLELEGVSCTTSSFCWEFVLKQVLVEANKPDLFDRCIIVRPQSTQQIQTQPSQSTQQIQTQPTQIKQDPQCQDQTLTEVEIEIEPPFAIAEDVKEEVQEATNSAHTVSKTVLDEAPDIEEIDFAGEVPIDSAPVLSLVSRSDVYYRRYKEAIRAAKEAKELALQSFLEARRIKDTYLMDCEVSDTDSLDSDA